MLLSKYRKNDTTSRQFEPNAPHSNRSSSTDISHLQRLIQRKQKISPSDVIRLQRTIGNQAVQRILLTNTADASSVLQREADSRVSPIENSDNEFIAIGENQDGKLVIYSTDERLVGRDIKKVSLVDSDNNAKKAKKVDIESNDKFVKITIDLDGDKNTTVAQIKVSGESNAQAGSGSDDVNNQAQSASNNSSMKNYVVKTINDFTSEEEYRKWLNSETLRICDEKGIVSGNLQEDILNKLDTWRLKDVHQLAVDVETDDEKNKFDDDLGKTLEDQRSNQQR